MKLGTGMKLGTKLFILTWDRTYYLCVLNRVVIYHTDFFTAAYFKMFQVTFESNKTEIASVR